MFHGFVSQRNSQKRRVIRNPLEEIATKRHLCPVKKDQPGKLPSPTSVFTMLLKSI